MELDRKPYSAGFTTGALLVPESLKVLSVYVETGDWEATRAQCRAVNILQARRDITLKKQLAEILARLRLLSEEELAFLAQAELSEQRLVLWLAVCRRYTLIGDFASLVLHENYACLQESVTHSDYERFFTNSIPEHPELDRLSDQTRRKMRQVIFCMLREAGLLDGWTIVPVLPGPGFMQLLRRAGQDALFFPIPASLL